ncbi:hypothetical protein BDZ97DRAFT_2061839 [Flammula alnicola]|nr:hypothetical protein BDZ97DRAFT_2061839 [Flammula alnicola]
MSVPQKKNALLEFLVLKSLAIASLAKKHLTLRRIATAQHSAIATLKVELLKKFPDCFQQPEHDKNLYLALRLLFSYHTAARFALKKGKKMDVGITKEAETKTIPPIQSATFPVMRTPASRTHGSSSSVHGSAKGGFIPPLIPPGMTGFRRNGQESAGMDRNPQEYSQFHRNPDRNPQE